MVVDPACAGSGASSALLPRIAAAVEAERARAARGGPGAAQPVLLDAGDALFPSPLIRDLAVDPDGARDLVAALRSAGYDALATGNTTLSAPYAAMRGLLSAAVTGDLPLIATNLRCADAEGFADAEEADEACRQGLVGLTRRSAVIERGGLEVGVFSVLPDDLAERLARGNMAGAELTAPLEATRQTVRELRADGADLVVLLSHLDRNETAPRMTLELLSRLAAADAPDLVITAGTANLAIQMSTSLGPVVVAVAEDAVGRIELERSGGRWRAAEAGEATAAAGAASASADLLGRIVSSWQALYCERQVRQVPGGELSGPMERDDFQHLALRAMREQARADIAVLNAGLVADDGLFPIQGPLTQGHVRRALPYDNELRVATIRGGDLGDVAERLVESGAAVLEGIEERDGGYRINGRDIEIDARYRLVTIDFVAEGGDGILDPEALELETPRPGAGGSVMLADRILSWLGTREGGEEPYDPDARLDLHTRPLWSGTALIDAAISDIQINDRSTGYAQPPLDRQELFDLSLSGDFRGGMSTRDHRWENTLRLRYGRQRLQAEVGSAEHAWAESDDMIQLRSSYTFDYIRNRLLDGAWYGPSLFAVYQLESEFAHEGEGDHFLEMTGLLGVELNPLAWLKLAVGAGVRSTVLADDNAPVPGVSFRGEIARRHFFGLPSAPIYLSALVDYFLLLPDEGPTHKLTLEGRVEVEIYGPLRLSGSLRLFLYEEANGPVATALDTTFGLSMVLTRRTQTF
jgi:2',3'-cyclic-nucleotide 2'-phosphodiesterase (5'-nucleotidase family)